MSANSAAMNHVFIDFENVSLIDPTMIGADSFHFTIFIGAKQTKLNTSLVEALIAHASSVQLVRVTTTGKNALDLVLASYVGQAVLSHPSALFHIVSKDKDYDALITHLRERQIAIQRHVDCSKITSGSKASSPAVKVAKKTPAKAKAGKQDGYSLLVAHLRKNIATRPKTKKSLFGVMKNFLEKGASEDAKQPLFERLKSDGHLSSDDKDRILYHFSEQAEGSPDTPAGYVAATLPISEDLFPTPCPSPNPKLPNTPL